MMKTRKLTALLLFVSLILSLCASCAKKPPETIHNIPYTAIGNPTAEAFPDNGFARSPWDMALYKDVLYIGSGDYDKNVGPISIHSYNTQTGAWAKSEPLPEEEFNRFRLLDGVLATPGIDSKEDWAFGNYFTLGDAGWEKHRTIPGGVHVFDMISFGGALFAGIGVESGGMPVVRSMDGGESFSKVLFYKDGIPVDTKGYTYIRTYDFFELDGKLYATFFLGNTEFSYEMYEYDPEDNTFYFHADLQNSLTRVKYNHMRITDTVTLGDAMYVVTGRLYKTGDMMNFELIEFDDATLVCDIYEHDGEVYLLTAAQTKTEGESPLFKASVWQAFEVDGNIEFYEIFNLCYDIPALSLATDGKNFYIGMSNTTANVQQNGTVLHVEYK